MFRCSFKNYKNLISFIFSHNTVGQIPSNEIGDKFVNYQYIHLMLELNYEIDVCKAMKKHF